MNPWAAAGAALIFTLVPLGWAVFRQKAMSAVAAILLANSIATALLMLLAEATNFSSLYDLALASALLSLGTGLVFTRILQDWL